MRRPLTVQNTTLYEQWTWKKLNVVERKIERKEETAESRRRRKKLNNKNPIVGCRNLCSAEKRKRKKNVQHTYEGSANTNVNMCITKWNQPNDRHNCDCCSHTFSCAPFGSYTSSRQLYCVYVCVCVFVVKWTNLLRWQKKANNKNKMKNNKFRTVCVFAKCAPRYAQASIISIRK